MNKYILITLLLCCSTIALGHDVIETTKQTVTNSGITLGSAIAIVASWDRN